MSKEEDGEDKNHTFISLLTSIWRHPSKDTESHSTAPLESNRSSVRKDKAVDTLGSGSFSLQDLDNRMNGNNADSATKQAQSLNEKSVARYFPDIVFASDKRNAEFHKLFATQISPTEPLVEDSSCALAKDILVQGRLYITPYHICFHSNILGWTTSLVISFHDILDIQPKNTAGVFPNGFTVRTLHAKYTLASFVSRDHILKSLLKFKDSPINSRERYGDREELAEDKSTADSDTSYENSLDNEYYSGDESDETSVDKEDKSPQEGSSQLEAAKTPKRSASTATKSAPKASGGWPAENLGPETHKPTTLPEMDSKEKLIDESTLNCPPGVVGNLLYGKDTKWLTKFQTDTLKNRELSTIPPFSDENGKMERKYEYIKPLSGPVGPKQTKCKTTETIENNDYDSYFEVLMAVKTPDVPSGDSFTTYTRCVLGWAEDNKTIMRHSTWLEWTSKSWLKGAIERGATEGQNQYCKQLVSAIEDTLRSSKGGGPKPKRSKKVKSSAESTKTAAPSEPFLTTLWNHAFTILVVVLLVTVLIFVIRYFTQSRQSSVQQQLQQELELWQWLDSRLEDHSVVGKASEELSEEELREVIRFTQMRLDRLKATLSQRGERS